MVADVYLNPFFMVFGALFPDADHPKSALGRIIPLWIFTKHRGITHTIQCMLCISLLILLITKSWNWAFSFFLGYLTHLLLDSTTPSGIYWLGNTKRD